MKDNVKTIVLGALLIVSMALLYIANTLANNVSLT